MRKSVAKPTVTINDKRPYVVLPNQLSNKQLLKNDRISKDPTQWLFPDGTFVDRRGRLTNALQFIVGIKHDPKADPAVEEDTWKVDNILWLGSRGTRTQVRIKKSRKCAPDGKRYVLLESVGTKKINYLERQITPVFNIPAGGNSIGIIHGESNPSAGTSHSGGQSNCYGVAFLVKEQPDRQSELNDDVRIDPFARLEKVVVAVLDSGTLDAERGDAVKCSEPTPSGWNFVDDNAFPKDDHLGLHGTKVSRIIKRHAPGATILPVKVSDRHGVLDLYDVLCGLEYARTHEAKVVNASWSFTGNKGNTEEADFPLLLGAIRDLDESGVMVVAAAGNRSQYVPEANGEIARDGAPKIYPACYSAIQCNVITVTTVIHRRNRFSVFENYSSHYVDTGVLPSEPTAAPALPEGEFSVPGFKGSYEGSSFATPIVAARVATILSSLTGFVSKGSILRRLSGFQEEDDLVNEIRYGGCYITE